MSDAVVGAPGAQPVRVALMNDYEVVVAGLQAMLAPYADRVRVVELDSLLPVHTPVDVLLYDAFGRERVTGPVEQTIAETDAKVVIYTWHLAPELVQEALAKGAVGCLSKTLEAPDLVAALEKVHAGERIVAVDTGQRLEPQASPAIGLTPRESHVVALIAAGAPNKEIARQLELSMNTVKSHIRTAYRAMGVTSRTQAVLWAVDHGITAPWVAVRDEVAS